MSLCLFPKNNIDGKKVNFKTNDICDHTCCCISGANLMDLHAAVANVPNPLLQDDLPVPNPLLLNDASVPNPLLQDVAPVPNPLLQDVAPVPNPLLQDQDTKPMPPLALPESISLTPVSRTNGSSSGGSNLLRQALMGKEEISMIKSEPEEPSDNSAQGGAECRAELPFLGHGNLSDSSLMEQSQLPDARVTNQHSEEANYPHGCPQCPRRYLKKDSMMQHVRRVHNAITLYCPKCPKTFKRKEYLDRHLKNPANCAQFLRTIGNPLENQPTPEMSGIKSELEIAGTESLAEIKSEKEQPTDESVGEGLECTPELPPFVSDDNVVTENETEEVGVDTAATQDSNQDLPWACDQCPSRFSASQKLQVFPLTQFTIYFGKKSLVQRV